MKSLNTIAHVKDYVKHQRPLLSERDQLLTDAVHTQVRVSAIQTDSLAMWVKSWLHLFAQEEKWSQQSITPTQQTYWPTLDTHFPHTMTTHTRLLRNVYDLLNIVFEKKKNDCWPFFFSPFCHTSVQTFWTCTTFHHVLYQLLRFVKTSVLLDSFVSGTGLIRCPDIVHVGACVCSKPLTSEIIYSCYLPIASDKLSVHLPVTCPRTPTQ